MAGRVYIETTIPSAYVSTRTDPTSVHRRELTRAWWADQAPRYDVSISEAVALELAQGDWPDKAVALELVEPLQRVVVTDEAANVARRYMRDGTPHRDQSAPGAPDAASRDARNAVAGGRVMSNEHNRPVFVDVLIDEVRQRRRDLLASCGDDLDALVRLIRQREAEHSERMADRAPRPRAKS